MSKTTLTAKITLYHLAALGAALSLCAPAHAQTLAQQSNVNLSLQSNVPNLQRPVGIAPASTAPIGIAPIGTAPIGTANGWKAATGSTAVRGLWVDGFGPGLKTRAQVRQMVDDAAKMGVNTLFVQAVRRADCFCLRSSLPPVSDKNLQAGFDPLAEAITLAHARGMKVVAWVSVTGAGNLKNLNSSPNHVFKQHGPQSKDPWLNLRADGSWQEGQDAWLDPAIPAAADFMAGGILSLVKNYDIDGIQLDRIRYPDGGDWGYHPGSLYRYALETGRKGRPGVNDEYFKAWKRQQVTALVRRITVQAKALDPDLWVSAATITYGSPPKAGDLAAFESTAAYRTVMQDWPLWMREGLVDLNVPMNYKRENVAQQAGWFDGWNTFARSVQGQGLTAAGSSIYLNSPQGSADQARRALAGGVGWVAYSYRTPTVAVYKGNQSAAAGRTAVTGALSSTPLATPVSWNEAAPHRRGLMGTVAGKERLGGLKVELLQGGKVVATSLTDGGGFYGFMNVPAGETRIRVSGQAWKTKVPAVGVAKVPNLVIRKLSPVSAPKPSTAPAPGTPGAPDLAPPSPQELKRGGETPG